jgi:hypothetical protein
MANAVTPTATIAAITVRVIVHLPCYSRPAVITSPRSTQSRS